MKNIFIILTLSVLLFSCHKENELSNLITESGLGGTIGGIKLGEPVRDVEKRFKTYEISQIDSALYKMQEKEGDVFLYLITNNDSIIGLKFTIPYFKRTGTLCVDAPLRKIKRNFPNNPIYNNKFGQEFFEISNSKSYMRLKVVPDDEEVAFLGNYLNDGIHVSMNFSIEGHISEIELWKK